VDGFYRCRRCGTRGKHISIDVVSRWIPPKGRIGMVIIANGFSLSVSALLTVAALKFVGNEIQMKSVLFLEFPPGRRRSYCHTFGVMTFRFAFAS